MNKINPRARKDIIIIGIDEGSIREFSDQGIQWPSRGNCTRVLHDISQPAIPLQFFMI
jgi:CHASE2 domain-containing sensor protein